MEKENNSQHSVSSDSTVAYSVGSTKLFNPLSNTLRFWRPTELSANDLQRQFSASVSVLDQQDFLSNPPDSRLLEISVAPSDQVVKMLFSVLKESDVHRIVCVETFDVQVRKKTVIEFYDVRAANQSKKNLEQHFGTGLAVVYRKTIKGGLQSCMLIDGLSSVEVTKRLKAFGEVRNINTFDTFASAVEFYDSRDAAFAHENLNQKFFQVSPSYLKIFQGNLLKCEFCENFQDAELILMKWRKGTNSHIVRAPPGFEENFGATICDFKHFDYGDGKKFNGASGNLGLGSIGQGRGAMDTDDFGVNVCGGIGTIPPRSSSASSSFSAGSTAFAVKFSELSCATVSDVSNELDLFKIANDVDKRTTFMIKNIPNKYTQKMLLDMVDETHKGEYDFIYLRMDFKNRCNVGYAFINFIDPKSVISFALRVVGKKWTLFNSDKVCMLSYANIQGKYALIEKFRDSLVMTEEESYRPKIFYSDGPYKGKEEPFPPPSNGSVVSLTKSGKSNKNKTVGTVQMGKHLYSPAGKEGGARV